eukprot:1186885-Prymnesium_polylepis.1
MHGLERPFERPSVARVRHGLQHTRPVPKLRCATLRTGSSAKTEQSRGGGVRRTSLLIASPVD